MTHIVLPYRPKKAESMKASPRIGPAAPANRKRIPSAFHNALSPGRSRCVVVVLFVEAVEGLAEFGGGEERPTRFEGTRSRGASVCRRTFSTSSLFSEERQ